MQLILHTPIKEEKESSLGMAIQGQLQTLREKGFRPTVAHVDPHSMFRKLRTQFLGVLIDVGGARDHVPKCDAKIRHIKDTYRCVIAGLQWKLPTLQVYDLLAYCVSRLNLRRTSLQGTMSPRFLFTGKKSDFKRELSLSIGDYVGQWYCEYVEAV